MDRDTFDRLSRVIGMAGTRRDALRALIAGAVAGTAAGSLTGLETVEAKRKRRRGRQRKAHGQAVPLQCPNTCNVNCSNKPLIPGSNLTKCNLNERDLDGVILSSANLTSACFGNSSLRYASFRSANLSKTCFCGADLTGADFRGTRVTAGQLGCAAKVACNTILPNGKPAVGCRQGETCCDGECVGTGSDPNNCGACGVQCGACQFCNFGTCENLADFEFDCNRNPLQIDEAEACTTTGNTGICDGGFCNCGPGGRYDEESNVCLCNAANTAFCRDELDACCEIESTCLVGGTSFQTRFQCPACDGDGGPLSNLCCEYLCAASGPGPRPKKYVCIDNAVPGQTRCDASFERCSFNDARFVDACATCGS